MPSNFNLPEDERELDYQNENVDSLIENIFPKDFDKRVEDKKLLVQLNVLEDNLPDGSSFGRDTFSWKGCKQFN